MDSQHDHRSDLPPCFFYGRQLVLATDTAGRVYSFGEGAHGKLLLGDSTDRLTATLVGHAVSTVSIIGANGQSDSTSVLLGARFSLSVSLIFFL